MTNPSYRKIAENCPVRLECPIDKMTYTHAGATVIIEADATIVFAEIEPIVEAPAETLKPKDLEEARQELAKAIEAAKVAFERDTGTILTDISLGFMTHHNGNSGAHTIDMSILANVGLTAVYPAFGGRGQVTWSAE